MNTNLRIGTCSWNYSSWVGLIYSDSKQTAAEYLKEYSKKYNTVEIDSWFYRIPSKSEVIAYKNSVHSDFRFTCKVPQEITLTHMREKNSNGKYVVNPFFLSVEQFNRFLNAIDTLLPQMDYIMCEFEYLNKEKMGSLNEFMDKIASFIGKIPKGLPYSLEPRNKNYLTEKYFSFLQSNNLGHVFSEKIYMPHIYDVYNQFKEFISGDTVIRLMGRDRGEIEERTNNQWNKIVEEKADKDKIVEMIVELVRKSKVTVNVNNHYEGSAPLTIAKLMEMIETKLD